MKRYKLPKANVLIKVKEKGKKDKSYVGMFPKRFSSIPSFRKNKIFDVLVRYPIWINAFGKKSRPVNHGTYDNYKDALYMLKAFLEE